jgi:hypothetical protein
LFFNRKGSKDYREARKGFEVERGCLVLKEVLKMDIRTSEVLITTKP